MAMFNDVHNLNIQNSNVSHVQGDQHNSFVTNNVTPNNEETTLGLLKPVGRDGYHVPRCMEGTRENVFKEIIAWLNGAYQHHLMWYLINVSSSAWIWADTEHPIDHWQPWSWKVCDRV
jgi:hypothetical protein